MALGDSLLSTCQPLSPCRALPQLPGSAVQKTSLSEERLAVLLHSSRLIGNIGQQSYLTGTLDGHGQITLMTGTGAGHTAGNDLGALRDILAQTVNVLIINMLGRSALFCQQPWFVKPPLS